LWYRLVKQIQPINFSQTLSCFLLIESISKNKNTPRKIVFWGVAFCVKFKVCKKCRSLQ